MLAGSSCAPEDRQEVVLVDYEFEGSREDAAFETLFGADVGLHWFDAGWSRNPSAHGLWSLGDEATVQVLLEGKNCSLSLDCSTLPALARQGQQLSVLLNGKPVGQIALEDQWAVARLDTLLPDRLVKQGYNTLTLAASVHVPARSREADPRPLALFLRRLQIRGNLTAKEQQRWEKLNAAQPAPGDWELVSLAETGDRETGSPAAENTAGLPVQQPDVFIILLDAARADHFSCYGYDRPTSPRIDGLAAEGLRFTRVFSNAPFTLVAVPAC